MFHHEYGVLLIVSFSFLPPNVRSIHMAKQFNICFVSFQNTSEKVLWRIHRDCCKMFFFVCNGVLLDLLHFRPFSCRALCNICLDTFMPEDSRLSKMSIVVVVGFALTLLTIFLFLPLPSKLFVVWWF